MARTLSDTTKAMLFAQRRYEREKQARDEALIRFALTDINHQRIDWQHAATVLAVAALLVMACVGLLASVRGLS